jgi:hypothetical protein
MVGTTPLAGSPNGAANGSASFRGVARTGGTILSVGNHWPGAAGE